jgi:hypothetical protein
MISIITFLEPKSDCHETNEPWTVFIHIFLLKIYNFYKFEIAYVTRTHRYQYVGKLVLFDVIFFSFFTNRGSFLFIVSKRSEEFVFFRFFVFSG